MDYKINSQIEGIARKSNKKDGSPYIDKNKKTFSVVSIKLSKDLINDMDWSGWCSVMDYGNDFMFKEGEMLRGYISKRTVDDQIFWNFRKPSKVDELEERIEILEERLEALDKGGSHKMTVDQEEEIADDTLSQPMADEEELDLPF